MHNGAYVYMQFFFVVESSSSTWELMIFNFIFTSFRYSLVTVPIPTLDRKRMIIIILLCSWNNSAYSRFFPHTITHEVVLSFPSTTAARCEFNYAFVNRLCFTFITTYARFSVTDGLVGPLSRVMDAYNIHVILHRIYYMHAWWYT